jgi:hypothetical protein
MDMFSLNGKSAIVNDGNTGLDKRLLWRRPKQVPTGSCRLSPMTTAKRAS